MAEVDKDKELTQILKQIDWGKYFEYGIIEVRIRDGVCKIIEIRRSYTTEEEISIS